ncbi:MAG: sodium:proton exchanger [Candidatus Buchananbacteria bacterium RIFCSPHIGHO2_02_FULL_40_13]|nr:MAG: sodium:proton exchanger [Candidatus Buchananbacteria bacterium RIFCSPHIGHO2_02_FULL_40_13]
MLTYILLILGFVFLIKGVELLIDGSTSLAKRFGLSDLVIGLTIVAFGTSAPELVINLISNFRNLADLTLGNIIGANIANILLIGGLAALIAPIQIRGKAVSKEIVLGLLALIALLLFANDFFLNNSLETYISRWDGLFLIILFSVFLYYTFGLSKADVKDIPEYTAQKLDVSLAYVILGIGGLIVGSKWIIDGALTIAIDLNFSQGLIGLTLLAVGTSLPELATSLIAAFKKKGDLAIGNIVGSTVFNIFGIIGLSALIRPLPFNNLLNTDIIIALGATVLLFWFVLTGKKERDIERWEGLALFCLYLVYLSFLIWRG